MQVYYGIETQGILDRSLIGCGGEAGIYNTRLGPGRSFDARPRWRWMGTYSRVPECGSGKIPLNQHPYLSKASRTGRLLLGTFTYSTSPLSLSAPFTNAILPAALSQEPFQGRFQVLAASYPTWAWLCLFHVRSTVKEDFTRELNPLPPLPCLHAEPMNPELRRPEDNMTIKASKLD